MSKKHLVIVESPAKAKTIGKPALTIFRHISGIHQFIVLHMDKIGRASCRERV